MTAKIIHASLALMTLTLGAFAQAPTPVVVQAVPAVQAATPAAAAIAAPIANNSATDTLKVLRDLKAANEEILKKQAASLQQLDEIEKAAEQIKIYTKRG